MGNFKELVENYKNFIENVLISESELYDNYYEFRLAEIEKQETFDTNKAITKLIYQDILYDFIFNIKAIKQNLINAMDFFYEDFSKNETIKMYKQIQVFFPDFMIEHLENI